MVEDARIQAVVFSQLHLYAREGRIVCICSERY